MHNVQTIEALKILLEAGANINILDNDGYSALHYLFIRINEFKKSDLEITEALILAEDPSINDNEGKSSLLSFAAMRNCPEAISLLFAYGLDINVEDYTSLYQATKDCSLEAAKKLISLGANVNAKNLILKIHKTALHGIADIDYEIIEEELFNELQLITLLLSAGAYVNAEDQWGRIPLFYCQDGKSTKMLLEAGSDLSVIDNHSVYKKEIDESNAWLKIAEYTDILFENICGSSEEFIRDLALEAEHKDFIAERIDHTWEIEDLNHPNLTKAQQNLWDAMTAFDMDNVLKEQILNSYTKHFNSLAIDQLQMAEILRDIIPVMVNNLEDIEAPESIIPPLPQSSGFLDHALMSPYLQHAKKIIDAYVADPYSLLLSIVMGENRPSFNANGEIVFIEDDQVVPIFNFGDTISFYKKLPSLEEALSLRIFTIENIATLVKDIHKLRHKDMLLEMQELTLTAIDKILAIGFDIEEMREFIEYFYPEIDFSHEAAGAGAGSVAHSASSSWDARTYKRLDPQNKLRMQYDHHPEELFKNIVVGGNLLKSFTDLYLPDTTPTALNEHADDINISNFVAMAGAETSIYEHAG